MPRRALTEHIDWYEQSKRTAAFMQALCESKDTDLQNYLDGLIEVLILQFKKDKYIMDDTIAYRRAVAVAAAMVEKGFIRS